MDRVRLTETLHANVGHHGSEVDDPSPHAVGKWRLRLELPHGVFAAEEDAARIDAHVSVERIFIDLVDRLWVSGLTADARIVDHAWLRISISHVWLDVDTYISSRP